MPIKERQNGANVCDFVTGLTERTRQHGPFCLGLDPTPELLASWALAVNAGGARRFCNILLEAAAGTVAIVKPQAAYFEVHGPQGMQVLADITQEAKQRDFSVILDAKRGDIGSTAKAYGEAYVGSHSQYAVDAMTVSPYLGLPALRSIAEIAADAGRGLFVVAKSSNDTAWPIQEATVEGTKTVARYVVDAVRSWCRQVPHACQSICSFGIVAGATIGRADRDLLNLQRIPVLAPGLGQQRATWEDLTALAHVTQGFLVPSASRSIAAAGPDAKALCNAIRQHADRAADLLT